jgi:hypothetical protein
MPVDPIFFSDKYHLLYSDSKKRFIHTTHIWTIFVDTDAVEGGVIAGCSLKDGSRYGRGGGASRK